MKLITNNTDPLNRDGVIIRADISDDGKSTTYKVYNNGVLLDTIIDDSVLTTANNVDSATVDKVATIKKNAYSKVTSNVKWKSRRKNG